MPEQFTSRAQEYFHNVRVSLGTCAVMGLSNIIAGSHNMMVYANDSLSQQMLLAYPSALPTPEVTGIFPADLSIQLASTFITTEIARRTSSARQLVTTAIAAQGTACIVDSAVERTGWLSTFERAQPDVGFSAISAAWFGKLLLDRSGRAKTPLRRNLWRAGATAYAGAITAGYYFLNGAEGGKLELTSHTAGLAVGAVAHILEKRKNNALSDMITL